MTFATGSSDFIHPRTNGNQGTIAVLIPTRGVVRIEWAERREELRFPLLITHYRLRLAGHDIDEARNLLVERALTYVHPHFGRAEWFFFLGDDVLLPSDGIAQLFYKLRQYDLPLLSGWYRAKDGVHVPVIAGTPGSDWVPTVKSSGIEQVFCSGADCLLIRRDVFTRLPKPWFLTDSIELEADVGNPALSAQHSIFLNHTEDVFFAKRLVQAGIPWHLDWSVGCGHIALDGTIVVATTDDLFGTLLLDVDGKAHPRPASKLLPTSAPTPDHPDPSIS